MSTHEEEIAGHQQRDAYEIILLFYHHPRVVLESLQIEMMFKHWKSNKGQKKSKVAMSEHLPSFFPVNLLFLSFPFSVKKTPNKSAKKP